MSQTLRPLTLANKTKNLQQSKKVGVFFVIFEIENAKKRYAIRNQTLPHFGKATIAK